MKSRVKRIHGNFIGQRGVHFSAKKCCGKCANVMPKGDADGRCYLGLKDMPMIYVKGGVMNKAVNREDKRSRR